jgi:hypothetical protein
MIKAQTVFDAHRVADRRVKLSQIDDFFMFAQTADSDAIKVHHAIFSVPAQNIFGFEISLPDAGIIKFVQPQRKPFQGPAFGALIVY